MTLSAQNPAAIAASQRSRFAAAYEVLEKAVAERAFPGAAFGVLAGGEVAAVDAVGRFTFDEEAPAVRPETVFDIASLTKVVATTSAAMLLHERGLLDLDLPLGEVLPGFVIGRPSDSPKHLVTLRMLLAHSSGLPAYIRFFESAQTPFALLRASLQLPLEAVPMQRAAYSDVGFLLLGKALEVLAGESLGAFCWREVFTPLGLSATRFCPPREWRTLIPPTENDASFRRRIIQGEVQDENCFVLGGCSGHAGLFSNVPDLLRFSQAILQPQAVLQPESAPALFQPETLALFTARQSEPVGTSRALGWDTPSEPSSSGRYFGPRSVGHLGYSGTSLWIDLDRQIAVALLTNRTWPDRSNEAIKQVRPAFHDAILRALGA